MANKPSKETARKRSEMRAAARTRQQLRSPGRMTEAGVGNIPATVAKVAIAAGKAIARSTKPKPGPRVAQFMESAPKGASSAKSTAAGKKASKAVKSQSAAAKTYATKDPARSAAAKKGAETRAARQEDAIRAARQQGRKQGAIAVGASGAAAVGVTAASSRPKAAKKKK
jgi:DNA-binding protein HU-beta